jgi:hypothetical protein
MIHAFPLPHRLQVEEASKDIKASPEEKASVNYMFRHSWECVSPLYENISFFHVTKLALPKTFIRFEQLHLLARYIQYNYNIIRGIIRIEKLRGKIHQFFK